MTIDVRQVCHPEAVRHFDTDALRRHFLIEDLFAPGKVALTYSHIDRLVVGGAMPAGAGLVLESEKPIGSPNFLDRRELGIVNLGGPGTVVADGASRIALRPRDALYVAMGTKEVRFAERRRLGSPRNSTSSARRRTRAYETVKIGLDKARRDRSRRCRDEQRAHDLPDASIRRSAAPASSCSA